MRINIQPRLQEEAWSLYWKDSLNTVTQSLENLWIEIKDPGSGSQGVTVQQLLDQAAGRLGWPPAGTLLRLDGFTQPWERAICKGT